MLSLAYFHDQGNEPLLQHVLPVLCQLCAEGKDKDTVSNGNSNDGDDDDDDDDDDEQTWAVAASTLDALALSVPAKYIFPYTAQFATPAIQSSNPQERMGALTVIGKFLLFLLLLSSLLLLLLILCPIGSFGRSCCRRLCRQDEAKHRTVTCSVAARPERS